MPDLSEINLIRTEEPTPVQLTRMEGILNLIAERGVNTDRRVDGHASELNTIKTDVASLKSETQTLREGADADKKTAVALAFALKEADENRRLKAEQSWSPITRIFAVIAVLGVLAGIIAAFVPHG
ncbi:hypothetical protein [Frigoribacterium sp. UYMn621]|uniref:hypothetical protein n=1 Tax=Frigoribacterium sp. UYMn621 TaxID=3156343 RepID=UPI003399CF60